MRHGKVEVEMKGKEVRHGRGKVRHMRGEETDSCEF